MALLHLCTKRSQLRLLSALPATQRLAALEAMNPQLHDAVVKLSSPGFSRKLTVETVEEAIGYIDDEVVLRAIADNDARTNVQGAALRAAHRLSYTAPAFAAPLLSEGMTTSMAFDSEYSPARFETELARLGRDVNTDWNVVADRYQLATTEVRQTMASVLWMTAPKSVVSMFAADLASGAIAPWPNIGRSNAAEKLMSAWDGEVTGPIAAWLSQLTPAQRQAALVGHTLTNTARETFEAQSCWDALVAAGDDHVEVVAKMLADNPLKWAEALLLLDTEQLDGVIVGAIDGLLRYGGGRIDRNTISSTHWAKLGTMITNTDLSDASRRALLRIAPDTVVASMLKDSRLSDQQQRELVKACSKEGWLASPEDIVNHVASKTTAKTTEAVRLVDAVLDTVEGLVSHGSWRRSWAYDHMVTRIGAACGENVTAWKVADNLIESGFPGTLLDLEATIELAAASMS